MLIKLLKYDLKYMLKNMSIFYILSIFFALTTRIFFNMEQSVIVNIIGQISVGCMFSMVISTLINTLMRCWVRFRDSFYRDESYLTHTLPVTKSELYDSKFIQTFIFFFVGFFIVLLSLFIAYYSKETWVLITNYIKNITVGLNMNILFFIIMVIILLFVEFFNAIQCGFLGMILGHKMNNGKLVFSILFGFISYLISQNLVLVLLFVYGLFDPIVLELFKTTATSIDVDSFKVLATVVSILYMVIIFAMSIVCKKLLKQGVNIE